MSGKSLSKIHVYNDVTIEFGTKQQKNSFAVGLSYLFKSPVLSHMFLAYLEPGIVALCVEPQTFISDSLLKQYEKELHRYGENSGFFSWENMILLAMTNVAFNDVYRKVRKTLPEHQLDDLEKYRAYARAVMPVLGYNILEQIRFSEDVAYFVTDIHAQIKVVFPQFRGILHENQLFEVIRDHVGVLKALPIIEINKMHWSRYKWKFLMSLVWIVLSAFYTYFFFTEPLELWFLHTLALAALIVGDLLCVCCVLPDIFRILDIHRKLTGLAKSNKFINTKATAFQKQKLIKNLLFLND